MKFDLPEPLEPIKTFTGRRGNSSAEEILLKPFTVMESSAFEDIELDLELKGPEPAYHVWRMNS
jgi:hypothetical protein